MDTPNEGKEKFFVHFSMVRDSSPKASANRVLDDSMPVWSHDAGHTVSVQYKLISVTWTFAELEGFGTTVYNTFRDLSLCLKTVVQIVSFGPCFNLGRALKAVVVLD